MHGQQTWEPIPQEKVSDRVSRRILEVITVENLQPGDRLPPERELAAMLTVGRPALREALHELKAQGLVQIRHGSGVFVADPQTTRSLRAALYSEKMDLEELFNMREVLELPAAAWAAKNADDAGLDAIAAAYDRLTAASLETDMDWHQLEMLDAGFHLRIVEAAGNRFLTRTQGVLQEILSRSMETTLQIPGRIEQSRLEHRRILDAIVARDAMAARRAAKAHISGSRKVALARFYAMKLDKE